MIVDQAEQSKVRQDHLDKLKQSGLTAAEYCRQHGLKEHQLSYWKKEASKAGRKAGPAPKPAAFVRVTPSQAPTAQMARPPAAARLVFGPGVAIEFGSGTDVAWITSLARAMGGAL
jgi:hypothetical protein